MSHDRASRVTDLAGELLREVLPSDMGFALVVFTGGTGAPRLTGYASDRPRDEMARAFAELAGVLAGRIPPHDPPTVAQGPRHVERGGQAKGKSRATSPTDAPPREAS